MKFKRNTGITLIALVVTIIVLLILAGITLSLALNSNGIFQRSKNAAAIYSEAEEAERAELERIGEEMDEVMGILPPLEIPEELKEGDTITYTPSGEFHWDAKYACSYQDDGSTTAGLGASLGLGETTSDYDVVDMQLATGDATEKAGTEDMSLENWTVVSIEKEEGKIVLMPTKSTVNMEKFSGIVVLQGAQGYNNGVKLLNDACSALYGNTKKGIVARNINMEDIEKILEEENVKNEEGETLLNVAKNDHTPPYGNRYSAEYKQEWEHITYRDNTGNYIQNKFFPVIYAKEKNSIINGKLNTAGWDLNTQNSYIERNEKITVNNTDYTAVNGAVNPINIRPMHTDYGISNYEEALNNKKDLLAKEKVPLTWIASRGVYLGDTECFFNISAFFYGYVDRANMIYSDGNESYGGGGLFPIVTIYSGTISGDETSGYTFT